MAGLFLLYSSIHCCVYVCPVLYVLISNYEVYVGCLCSDIIRSLQHSVCSVYCLTSKVMKVPRRKFHLHQRKCQIVTRREAMK